MRDLDTLELGVQSLDPRVQSLGDRGASFRPRTEKDTLERNFNSNSKANKEKGSEENHNPNPNSSGTEKRSQPKSVRYQEFTESHNEVETERTYQRQSTQSRNRNLSREEEDDGFVNNITKSTAKRGLTSIAAALPALEPRPEIDYTDARQVIQTYITDFAREFHDNASLRSSSTRALNLMKRSGLSLEVFINRMYQARANTKESTGSIKTKSGKDLHGIKSKMPYFFACLEEACGLTVDKD
jgi:hypothetical protein